ncbi:MAG: hypothetical protein ACPGVJ_00535, partial [Mangrovicoccus sp.]
VTDIAGNAGNYRAIGLANGGFVITWKDTGGRAEDSSGVFGRVYAADGMPGDIFLVNEATHSTQSQSWMTPLADGRFAVVYRSFASVTNSGDIYARFFLADGTADGGEIQINSRTADSQYNPSITELPNGDLMIIWEDYGYKYYEPYKYNSYLDDVRVQRLSSSGELLALDGSALNGASGETVLTATYGTYFGNERIQALSPSPELPEGGFVAVWTDSTTNNINGQIYALDGTLIRDTFTLTQYSGGTQSHPSLLPTSDGGFILTYYDSNARDGSGNAILQQRFTADGSFDGLPVVINEEGAGNQDQAWAAQLVNGTIVTAWRSDTNGEAGDGNGSGIFHSLSNQPSLPSGAEDPILLGMEEQVSLQEADLNAGITPFDADGRLSLTDADSLDFDGGTLLVTRLAGSGTSLDPALRPEDAREGDPGFATAGGVSLAGADISVNGVHIATLVQNGLAGAPLELLFNSNASVEAVEALLAQLGVRSDSDSPAPLRSFNLRLSDGDGGSYEQNIELSIVPEIDAPVVPESGERLVNTYSDSTQDRADIATLYDPITGEPSGYVIVWQSTGQDYPSEINSGIFAQTFDLMGQPTSAEFQVNSFAEQAQNYPNVVGLTGGGFVIAWDDYALYAQNREGDTSSRAAMARVYDADGLPLGEGFVLNQETSGEQRQVKVTALADGGFAAGYISANSGSAGDGNSWGVFGRLFDADGTARGSEFGVNSTTYQEQSYPQLAELGNGNLFYTWTSLYQDTGGSDYGIYGRVLDASGAEIVPEFHIGSYLANDQAPWVVESLPDGGVIVVYRSDTQDSSSNGVYQQRYDINGQPVGEEQRVNDLWSGNQANADVTVFADGSWLVAFYDAPSGMILGQRYDANGNRVDGNFEISETDHSSYTYPAVAALEGERFVAAYQSADSAIDGSAGAVLQRAFGGAELSQAPVITGLPENVTLDEAAVNSAPQQLFPHLSLGDAQSSDFSGGRLILAVIDDATVQRQFSAQDAQAQDQLSVLSGNGVVVTGADIFVDSLHIATISRDGSDGADLIIELLAGASAAQVERVVEQLAYANSSDDPEAGRSLSLILSDGEGGVLSETIALSITPQVETVQPVGGDIAVNSTTLNEQNTSDVAALIDPVTGEATGYVVVWQSYGQDTPAANNMGVYAQIFDLSGAPVGGEIRVADTVGGSQAGAKVIGTPAGGFAVVWWDDSSTHHSYSQSVAQIFDASGAKQGAEIHVEADAALNAHEYNPEIAVATNGDLIVVRHLTTSPYSLIIDWLSSSGAASGSEVQIQLGAGQNIEHSDLAVLSDGRIIVVFQVGGLDGSSKGIFGQILNADGSLQGGVFQINSHAADDQLAPAVAAVGDGFVVAFTSSELDDGDFNYDYNYAGVYARHFDATGTALGAQILINRQVNGEQNQPDVIGHADGSYTVVYSGNSGADGNGFGVFAQKMGADDTRIDGPLQINEQFYSTQNSPSVAALGDTAYVVAYSAYTGTNGTDSSCDGSHYGIYTRLMGDASVFGSGEGPVVDGVNAHVTYAENDLNGIPQLIDANGAAAVSDLDSANFDGGRLLVTMAIASAPLIEQINSPDDLTQDSLGLRQGARITIQATDVLIDGVIVAQIVSNGLAGAPFELVLNDQVTPELAELLIENLTYANASDDPLPERLIRLQLTDGDGGRSEPLLVTVEITPTPDAALPQGGEQQANTYTTDNQSAPEM